MTVTVVGVHGINCYRYYKDAGTPEGAASLMAAAWTAALTEGAGLAPEATADRLSVAYYSELLRKLRKRVTAQGADDLKWLTEGEQVILTELLRDLGAPPQVAQGAATVPFRQIGQWLAERLPGVGIGTVAAFCQEVQTYFGSTYSAQRQAVRDAVATAIADHRPRAIVAHSLGTVVAYETLWEHPDLQVDLLLTLGSPLGMPSVVQARLMPALNQETGRGARPPGVTTWLNVADKGDLVASPISLEKTFDGVTQLPDITIGAVSFHTATAYLRHPEVAARIAPYLAAPGR
jgi:hypothetical protein